MHTHSHSIWAVKARLPGQLNLRFALATLLNVGFVIAQVGVAWQAHSVSLLSDAVHNLGDVLGLAMAWVANALLTRGSSERYSYGLKKLTLLATLGNALLLLASSALIAYEATWKLLHPQAMEAALVIVTALAGIIINGGTALLFRHGQEADLNLRATFLHLAWDALLSFGVVLAAIAVYFSGWQWLDPLIAFGITLVIVWSSWRLLRHATDLTLGAVPHGIQPAAVRAYLAQLPGVADIHDLHIWALSTRQTALTAHLVMPGRSLLDADYQAIRETLANRFNIQHVTLQVEQGAAEHRCAQAIQC